MKKISYPHKIENGNGETIIFKEVVKGPKGDRVNGESFVAPGSGPPMHVHWQQDEGFTVIAGKMAYQIQGQQTQYAGPGDTLVFERGVAHRFWNAGEDTLHCEAWLEPAHNIVFFLTSIFDAQKKSGDAKPDVFDASYLLTRYASEFDMLDMPPFVRRVIVPTSYRIGQALGKYKHFEGAPAPLPELVTR
jgi:quercetin dioxygenase-like cupin family protein